MAQVIIDTGPLVALFDRKAPEHGWARAHAARLPAPLLTCDAVVSEAIFLMRRDGLDPVWLLDFHRRRGFRSDFDFQDEAPSVLRFFRDYADQQISLADACLVRMSELEPDSVIFTLDRDFLIYRRNGRQKIPLLAPFA